jgi:GNAT superfamily N-acetyltransferase
VSERSAATALDLAELAGLSDFQRAAAAHAAAEDAVELVEIGGAVCTAMPSQPHSLLGNRVVGLGISEPAADAVLDAVAAFYAQYGASFTIVADLPQLAARGYRQVAPWTRFVRGTDPLRPPPAGPAVELVEAAEAQAFGSVCATASGAPAYFAGWVGELVGRPGWHCYAVRATEAIVATAALYAFGDVGWLGFAATLPGYRGRGAQGALLAARVEQARRIGLSTLLTDTAAGPDETPSVSHRNIVRAGFRVESVRPNWEAP